MDPDREEGSFAPMPVITSQSIERPGLSLGGVELVPVLFVLGLLVTALGLSMLAPALLDYLVHDHDWVGFLEAAGVTLFCGLLMVASNWRHPVRLNLKQGFLLTCMAWVVLGLFGSLPFIFATTSLDFSDAVFESISGLTTTGSTVIHDLDHLPPGILFWRALQQWVGGIGIIGMAIALLPVLRVGGMQLFRMESSDTSERGLTRIGELGLSISAIYLVVTLATMAGYMLGGMDMFNAVCHAFATVSTGGFSTWDSSMGAVGPVVQWVAILGMMAGAMPFLLFVQAARGRPEAVFKDSQARLFVIFLLVCWLGVGTWLWVQPGERTYFNAITAAAFNITSVVTTTGFASEDYTLWGDFSILFFFLITFAGGCTGSTSGGIKTFRYQIAYKVMRAHVRRRYLPHSVILSTYRGNPIDEDVAASVVLFFFAMGATTAFVALGLTLLGLDWVTALSGAATAICNVGPGLGSVIGPSGNFATLPDSAKWLLTLGMLLGRLEFFTLLVLFSRDFWRR
jgi:trk system potassium uptake protein TrkH